MFFFFFFFFFKIREHSRELSRFPLQLVQRRGIVFLLIFVHYQNINLRRQFIQPEKTADSRRRYHWFPRQMTSEKQAQKFHTDDVYYPDQQSFGLNLTRHISVDCRLIQSSQNWNRDDCDNDMKTRLGSHAFTNHRYC